MTDVIKRPGAQCLLSEKADELTGWQVALSTMGLITLSAEDQAALADHPMFGLGWESGIEGDLINELPSDTDADEHDTDRRAWLMGFISGQIARAHDYSTPFCVLDHGSECDAINADEQTTTV